jgi:hypothetical protein
VGEDDALGIASTARGVLQESDVLGRRPVKQGHRFAGKILGDQHLGQGRRLGAQECGHTLRLRHGNDEHRFGVGQDTRVPSQVILNLRQPRGRIDRYGNATSEHDAEKAGQIVTAGGQHQGHSLPRQQAARDQAGGNTPRLIQQLAISDGIGTRLALLVAAIEQHMRTLWGTLRMPLKNLDQRLCLSGNADRAAADAEVGVNRRKALGTSAVDESQQILRRFGLGERSLGQRLAELAADTQQEFDPCQTVETQITLQMAGHAHPSNSPRASLLDHHRDHAQQSCRVLRRRLTSARLMRDDVRTHRSSDQGRSQQSGRGRRRKYIRGPRNQARENHHHLGQ